MVGAVFALALFLVLAIALPLALHLALAVPILYFVLALVMVVMSMIGKGPANTRGPALAQSRRYAVAVGGSQMCGSSWSMSRALWVGSRVSTSFRYA